LGCSSATNDYKIQKAIREGVNTLRLHDKERRLRQTRQLGETSKPDNGDCDDIVRVELPNDDVEPASD